MTVTYTGRHVELSPAQSLKLQAEFDKVSKLLDTGRGEKAAHVRLSVERHLHIAEVTLAYYGHEMVGQCSDGDLFTALHSAVGKLEKQVIRAKTKWRDSKREPHKEMAQLDGSAANIDLGEENKKAS